MRPNLFACLLCLFGCSEMFGQDTIRLKNPSFEGKPACCAPPKKWYSCIQDGETPTDVQPGFFEVDLSPAHGNTYVSMVVRDNNTWEGIGQHLEKPLRKGSAYSFSLLAAHEDTLISYSRMKVGDQSVTSSAMGNNRHIVVKTSQQCPPESALANYDGIARLQIWGGNARCEHAELLAESQPVENLDWGRYSFEFSPQRSDYEYFIIDAQFKKGSLEAYNGNVVIDNCSPIVQIK